jgi:hypothetical protein
MPVLLGVAAAPPLQKHVAPPAAVFVFNGARLGMSLEDWRARPFPGSSAAVPNAKPICSDEALAKPAGLIASTETSADSVVCAYLSHYGRYFLNETLPINRKYTAQAVRYVFRNDRLFRIEYQTTADAYDDLASQFDARYGPSIKLVRDTVATANGRYFRVTQTWRTPDLIVDLTDPVAGTSRLSISFTSGSTPPLGPARLQTSNGAAAPPTLKAPPA